MYRHHLPFVALALLSAAPPASAADLLIDCAAFRTRWSAASQAAQPGLPPLGFERIARQAGTERVANIEGVAATFACREGKMTHAELRDTGQSATAPGDADSFSALASAALVALEGGELAANAADRLLAAMRAEAERGRTASSEWGAYEITLTAGGGRRPELVIDHPEN